MDTIKGKWTGTDRIKYFGSGVQLLRACLHVGGGAEVVEVTCLDGVTRLSI